MLSKKNKVFLQMFSYLFISILYLELLFRSRVYTVAFDMHLLRIVAFSLAYTIFMLFFLMFFSKKTNKIVIIVLISYLGFTYFNQEIYHSIVNSYFSFSVAGDVLKALTFFGKLISTIRFGHLLYLVPLFALLGKMKYNKKMFEKELLKDKTFDGDIYEDFDIQYYTIKQPLVIMLSGLAVYVFTVFSISSVSEIDPNNPDLFTDRDLYNDLYSAESAIYEFGILTYTQRDVMTLFTIEDVDLAEQNQEIEDFLAEQPAHEENDYTNALQDKNFILIMAESLDTYAIVPELTPTLSLLKGDSLYFENYYSPLYYRNTADTEFLVQTGFYPNKGVSLSMEAYMDNAFPNTMARLFQGVSTTDYQTLSFHNYNDYFYPRIEFHSETLGFDEYFGSVRMEMQEEPDGFTLNRDWQSDIELMEHVVDELAKYDNFYANILTVSGHLDYDDKHDIASKHIDQVNEYEEANGLDLPSDIKYYLAVQIEFDLSLKYLIDELKEMDKFDDTVIMIFGDHYAYGLDIETIWEYDTIKEDGSQLDIHNVPMILYNTGFESQVMPNYMSSIDIMPTISNLYNLDLSYQEIFGKDALGADDNIVRFPNLSFVSNDFEYDILADEYTIREGSGLDITSVMLKKDYLIQEYLYNNMLLENDYFTNRDINN